MASYGYGVVIYAFVLFTDARCHQYQQKSVPASAFLQFNTL